MMMSEYMIKRQGLKNGTAAPAEKKAPIPIPKRSEKMKEQFKIYIPKVKEFLARPENKNCKIKMPGCTGKATAAHHSAGRTGDKLLDQSDWIPCCAHCNLSVEIKDLEAREKGFKKTRLGKSKKSVQ